MIVWSSPGLYVYLCFFPFTLVWLTHRSFSHATLENHFDTEGMKARRWARCQNFRGSNLFRATTSPHGDPWGFIRDEVLKVFSNRSNVLFLLVYTTDDKLVQFFKLKLQHMSCFWCKYFMSCERKCKKHKMPQLPPVAHSLPVSYIDSVSAAL